MSIDATKWAWSLQNVTPTEKLILLSYADRAGESMEAWPSWRRLMLDTCLDRKTIYKGLQSLQQKGLMVKTGDTVKQVVVYRLLGVPAREGNLSTTSSKNGTGTKIGTGSKNGTGASPKNGTGTSSKNGTQNPKVNPKRNPKEERPSFSSFSSLSLFLNYIEKLFETENLPMTTDLVDQINFYAQKSKDKRDQVESAHIAINLLKKKQWNIPNGWQGITNKSIKEKEEAAQRAKEEEYKQDKEAVANIRQKINVMAMVYGGKDADGRGVQENTLEARV